MKRNTGKRKTSVQEAGNTITIITKEAKIISQNHGKRKSQEDKWLMEDNEGLQKVCISRRKYGTDSLFNVWPYFKE